MEKLGPTDAIKARESWGKVELLLVAAFRELRDYEYFGPRAPVSPAYTAPAAVLPLKLTEVIHPLRFEVKGLVAAASDGRVAFSEVSGGSGLHFPNHAAVRLTADTIHPVAKPGDVLLIRQHLQ